MDIYITNLNSNESIQLPMLPEKVGVAYESNFLSYDVLRVGEVKIPHGVKLVGIKWDGIFPGEPRKQMPFVRNWQEPKALHNWLEAARLSDAKMRVLMTETPINMDVHIASFTPEFAGGFGDMTYSISFIEAKDINIICESPADDATNDTTTDETVDETTSEEIPHISRPDRPMHRSEEKQTYTRKAGESLWDIAAKEMGDGQRWPEIYALNRALIGDDPTRDQPGQVYTLP